ncbi:MAG: dihydrofolate reductase [Opitutus sp.]
MAKTQSIIAACSENRVIGRDGRLPWRIAEDWDFFRTTTTGAVVVLGRVSFLSWTSLLKEDREAIVVTRDSQLSSARVKTAASLSDALQLAEAGPRPVFICGGETVFQEAIRLPQVAKLYLTHIHATIVGDRYFPEWRREFPRVLETRESADQNFRYTFCVLGREGTVARH